MRLKLAPLLVMLVIATGCVGPGLQGVQPNTTELQEAQTAILYGSLSSSRYLESDEWQETLQRVEERISDAAVATCLMTNAVDCERVRQRATIVPDMDINAWVDRDLVIGVHAGLLAYAGSDEEIAAVLAHEYGHVFARHFDRQDTNAGIGALAGLAVELAAAYSGYLDPETAGDLTTAMGQAGATAYSQQFELEADYYAALILDKAGIALDHGNSLLMRLARTSQGSANAGEWQNRARLMATTHPANDYRLARWMGVAGTLADSKRVSPDGIDSELRANAMRKLLDTVPWQPGVMTRWINPKTGNSGELVLRRRGTRPECAIAGKYHAECVTFSVRELRQDSNESTNHHACTVLGKSHGAWQTDDGQWWSWASLGTENPWGRNARELCEDASARLNTVAVPPQR